MSLWRPIIRSDLPLGPLWHALARHHFGVDHWFDGQVWRLRVERLERRADGWHRVPVTEVQDADEIEVIVKAIAVLPGVLVRLHLTSLLLGCYE